MNQKEDVLIAPSGGPGGLSFWLSQVISLRAEVPNPQDVYQDLKELEPGSENVQLYYCKNKTC